MTATTIVTGSKLRLNSYLNDNNILGFAVKNYRDRFLIPSNQNLFGGIIIEYVLIDSGSNSSLFPLPVTPEKTFDIHQLIKNFPYHQYTWSISTAHGIGLIPVTTLHIKPIEDADSSLATIKCNLHYDIKALEFNLPYLRFSLNKESVKILTETNEIKFSETDKEVLQNTLQFLNEFERKFPLMINKKKREYCLLGQHFLKTVCSIQLNDTMLFIDKDKLREKLVPQPNSSLNEMANYLYYQRPVFSKTEQFLNCEDDEHGGRDLFNISQQQVDVIG